MTNFCTHEEANALINSFMFAVANACNDEAYAMNEGLHENKIKEAGNDLYLALRGLLIKEGVNEIVVTQEDDGVAE